MDSNEVLTFLSYKTGLSKQEIKNIYNAYWAYIKRYIRHLDIKSCKSEQELIDKKTSVNIQGFGKFYFSWRRLENIIKNVEKQKEKNV